MGLCTQRSQEQSKTIEESLVNKSEGMDLSEQGGIRCVSI